MQEVQNKEQLEFYLEKHHIRELFDTPNLPFRLYRYEVGEMMNILHPGQEYLKFIVEGSFDFTLYAPMVYGTYFTIVKASSFWGICNSAARTRVSGIRR